MVRSTIKLCATKEEKYSAKWTRMAINYEAYLISGMLKCRKKHFLKWMKHSMYDEHYEAVQ